MAQWANRVPFAMSRRFSLKALLVLMLSAACFFGGIRVERERQRREDEAAALAARNAELAAMARSRQQMASAFSELALQMQQLNDTEGEAIAAAAIAQARLDQKLAELGILQRELAEAQQERGDGLRTYREVFEALDPAYRETKELAPAKGLNDFPKRRLIEDTFDKVDSPQSQASPSA